MAHHELPVIDPATVQNTEPVRDGRIVAVVLAAGGSHRFGDANKLLAEIDGEPIVARSVQSFVESDLDNVYVVTGDEAGAVRSVIPFDHLGFIHNEQWDEGQSTSVRAGLERAVADGAEAIVFGLGDMPWVASSSIDLIAWTYQHHTAGIITAAYEGQRGNPVLFDETTFRSLRTISGDTGGRELIQSRTDAIAVETGDPGVIRDIDYPDDVLEGESQ